MMAARQSLELTNHGPDLDSGKEPGEKKIELCTRWDGKILKDWIGLGTEIFWVSLFVSVDLQISSFFSGKSCTHRRPGLMRPAYVFDCEDLFCFRNSTVRLFSPTVQTGN